jgi:hypothetical protein
MARPRKNVQGPKLPKGVTEEFVDSINAMSTDELKAQIVILQVQNQDNEEFKASEGFTKAKGEFDYAKDRFDQVAGPVKETTVSCKNRTKLVVERLKEKGGA